MRQNGRALWHWLILTNESLLEGERRRSRLLAACLGVSVTALAVVALPLTLLSPNPTSSLPPNPVFWLTTATTAVFALAFAANRRGQYAAAARLTVCTAFASSWAALIYQFGLPGADFGSLNPAYLIGTMLVASLLLDVRATLLISMANAAGIILLGFLLPAFDAVALANILIFLVLVSGLVIVSSYVRRQDRTQLALKTGVLAENEARLQAILDNSTAIIYMKNLDGRYLVVNRQYEKLFHVTREQLMGRRGEGLFPPAVAERYWQQDLKVLQSGQPVEVEETTGAEFDPHTFISVKFPIRDARGDVYAVCSISTDISERKEAEQALAAERDLLQSLMDNIPDLVYIKDRDSRLTGFNKAFMKFARLNTPEDALSKTDFDFQPVELAREFFAEEQTIINTGNSIRDRIEYNPLPDGTPRWLSATKAPLVDKHGAITGIVGISRDVTERRRTEQELEAANARLRTGLDELEQRTREMKALNEMSDFLQSCAEFSEAFSVVSGYAGRLFPKASGVLYVINASRNLVEPVAQWGAPSIEAPAFHSGDCWALRRGRAHHMCKTDAGEAQALLCDHVRPPYPAESMCIPLVAQGDTLGVLHLQHHCESAMNGDGMTDERSESQQQLARTVADSVAQSLGNLQLRETLRNQSIRDPLTNLFNRRYLEETLDRELQRAARGHTSLSVLMMDIDHFKQFNDSYGHDAGDYLLHELGNFLQASIRAGDIACRFGGEEFTIVFPETTLEFALQRAGQLRESIRGLRYEHLGQALGLITISLGIATYPQHGVQSEQLLRAADSALYRAKREGRDRVVTAT